MKIVRESKIQYSFRNQTVIGQFDLNNSTTIKEEFDFQFETPENWKLGVIVGNSGTGKTTIAKDVFNLNIETHKYDINKSVIDEFPINLKTEEITQMFTLVGFASPKSWLKPYQVLSNGEKMRVDLARCLLDDNDFVVFDEFTSVVDRDVAKTMCLVINKVLKTTNKKIVLVSCHFDILNFLDTDWIFNTNTMQGELGKKKDSSEKSNYSSVIIQLGNCLKSITI